MPKDNDDKIATTENESTPQNVAVGNEEKQIADKSNLDTQAKIGDPVPVFSETTKPADLVDTDKDEVIDPTGADAKKMYAEYEKGAFNPEQIAAKFNVEPSVVYLVIDEMSKKKHDK